MGLGNPGKKYEQTRHNVGFALVDHLAKKWNGQFKENKKMHGQLAQATCGQNKVFLLKPATFMNLSGKAVISALNYYDIHISHLLIVADDIHTPIGEMRLKIDSGTGGHKGLEDIERQLGTKGYPRLKIGVGNASEGVLTGYVLGKFSQEEIRLLPQVIERATQAIEVWFDHGLVAGMNVANIRTKKKVIEEQNIGDNP